MPKPLTKCLNCREELPAPSPSGGRPRLYCSDRCRWTHRRVIHRTLRPVDRRWDRATETKAARRRMREQAERLAQAAGEVVLKTRAEDLAPVLNQTGGTERPGPIAAYTAAALPLLARARALVASAVAADRAVGGTWEEIAAVLGVSPDTAARHYR